MEGKNVAEEVPFFPGCKVQSIHSNQDWPPGLQHGLGEWPKGREPETPVSTILLVALWAALGMKVFALQGWLLRSSFLAQSLISVPSSHPIPCFTYLTFPAMLPTETHANSKAATSTAALFCYVTLSLACTSLTSSIPELLKHRLLATPVHLGLILNSPHAEKGLIY